MKHSVERWFGNERIHGSVRVRSSKVAGYHREDRTNLSGDIEDSWCGRHRGWSAPLRKSTSFGVGTTSTTCYSPTHGLWEVEIGTMIDIAIPVIRKLNTMKS